jgi:hypothetical protein
VICPAQNSVIGATTHSHAESSAFFSGMITLGSALSCVARHKHSLASLRPSFSTSHPSFRGCA